jgi:hypothetical protein
MMMSITFDNQKPPIITCEYELILGPGERGSKRARESTQRRLKRTQKVNEPSQILTEPTFLRFFLGGQSTRSLRGSLRSGLLVQYYTMCSTLWKLVVADNMYYAIILVRIVFILP